MKTTLRKEAFCSYICYLKIDCSGLEIISDLCIVSPPRNCTPRNPRCKINMTHSVPMNAILTASPDNGLTQNGPRHFNFSSSRCSRSRKSNHILCATARQLENVSLLQFWVLLLLYRRTQPYRTMLYDTSQILSYTYVTLQKASHLQRN